MSVISRIAARTMSLHQRVGLVLLVALVATPVYALFHAVLRSSAPSAGATVAQSPRELRLTFSEAIELPFTRITVLAGGRDTVVMGRVAHDSSANQVVVVPVTSALKPGSYTVKYRVAGHDGHPMGGSYVFTVGGKK